jgi:hypothetical protein
MADVEIEEPPTAIVPLQLGNLTERNRQDSRLLDS